VRFILASQSPRRRDLFTLTGIPFEAISTDIDENRRPGEPPAEYVQRLSREKARAAARMLTGAARVLAADTIVVDGDDVLEKPADAAQATAMLRRLRGHTHHVLTAISLLDTPDGEMRTHTVTSPVRMRAYTDAEINAYVASDDPFDKAGAYSIQNSGFHPSVGFDHCFASVMGLPLCHLTRLLRALGDAPPADVPSACQEHLAYDCPVYAAILAGRM
jgi:septum formation protein